VQGFVTPHGIALRNRSRFLAMYQSSLRHRMHCPHPFNETLSSRFEVISIAHYPFCKSKKYL